jgi:hypothetical protein
MNCLTCRNEFFVKNRLDFKENDEHALAFALHLSRLFLFALNRACHSKTSVRLKISSPNTCLIMTRVFVELFPRFTSKISCVLAVPLSDPSQNLLSPDTRFQIKGFKISTSNQLPEILLTDSKDMIVTVSSRYYNYVTDGNTNPLNYGY